MGCLGILLVLPCSGDIRTLCRVDEAQRLPRDCLYPHHFLLVDYPCGWFSVVWHLGSTRSLRIVVGAGCEYVIKVCFGPSNEHSEGFQKRTSERGEFVVHTSGHGAHLVASNNAVAFQVSECIAECFPADPANSSLKIAEPLPLLPQRKQSQRGPRTGDFGECRA